MGNYWEILKFNTYQICWAIITIPILSAYAVIEFKRSIEILKYNRFSFFIVQRIRIWLIRIILGQDQATQYAEKMITDQDRMRKLAMWGTYQVIIAALVIIFFSLVLVNSLR
jgi:hypothetical protein